jgi:Sap, sulfolipid-1-addressing protein
MWTYVFCLGFAMLIDPVRIGIAAVLMSRRQALVSLLAFWVGGMIAGVTVGIAVLVLLHDVALVAIEAAAATINDVRSAVIILTGEHLRITLGVLALVALAVMLVRDRAQVAAPVPVSVGSGGSSEGLPEAPKRTLFSLMATRIHEMLESGFAWPAFVVGLMSTFPPLEGPMALTVIMGSRAAAGTQFVAFIVFILLVLVFIEIPLVSYLAAPQRTQAVMLAMNGWITAHRRQIVEAMLAVMGIASLVQGISSL